jgi:hypothetical protein
MHTISSKMDTDADSERKLSVPFTTLIVRDLYTYMGWSLGPSGGPTELKELQTTNTASALVLAFHSKIKL